MNSYTFEELRKMGCPDGLLMQYFCMTKDEINKIVEQSAKD